MRAEGLRKTVSLRRSFGLLTKAAAATALLAAACPAVQALSLNDAIFSAEQAKTGRRLYRKHCQTCHEEEYFETVVLVWNGEPLSELFSVMAAIMPQNNPGSLTDQEYLDVLAYIFSAGGYPEGSQPLLSSDLNDIAIEPRR